MEYGKIIIKEDIEKIILIKKLDELKEKADNRRKQDKKVKKND